MRQLVGLSSTISNRKLASWGCGSFGSYGGRRRLGGGLQRQAEMEGGPLVGARFLADIWPPMSSTKSFADGQAEAGPSVLPRRRGIRLSEGLEQAQEPIGWNADAGVTHGKMEPPKTPSWPLDRPEEITLTWMTTSPAVVNLTPLLSKLTSTCRTRVTSPRNSGGIPSSN